MAFELNEKIKQDVRELTEDLYDGYSLKLDKLCKKLGLQCYFADFENDQISGALIKTEDGKGFEIFVNKDHPPTRQRFTIAHECGHYISYRNGSFSTKELTEGEGFQDQVFSLRAEGVYSEAESEANEIAAELLMPKEKVLSLIKKNSISPETMAQYFQVSESSLLIRVQNLGYRVVY